MRNQGFPRRSRMTEREEFIRLFDKPRVFRGATFQAFWKTNDRGMPRLGITIKGKLSSVWRVRIKRTVREWFRVAKSNLENGDFNIVVRVPQKLDMEFIDNLRRQLHEWKS